MLSQPSLKSITISNRDITYNKNVKPLIGIARMDNTFPIRPLFIFLIAEDFDKTEKVIENKIG